MCADPVMEISLFGSSTFSEIKIFIEKNGECDLYWFACHQSPLIDFIRYSMYTNYNKNTQ